MNDAKGKELEVGQRVALASAQRIQTGEVVRVRLSKSYGVVREAIKIQLDVPEPRRGTGRNVLDQKTGKTVFEYGKWDYSNGYNSRVWIPKDPPAPHTSRECWYGERLLILNEEVLTKQ